MNFETILIKKKRKLPMMNTGSTYYLILFIGFGATSVQ